MISVLHVTRKLLPAADTRTLNKFFSFVQHRNVIEINVVGCVSSALYFLAWCATFLQVGLIDPGHAVGFNRGLTRALTLVDLGLS